MDDSRKHENDEQAVKLVVHGIDRPAKQGNESPRFTVIIPCFNEEESILPTLDHLRDQLHGAGPYELIVVNDGSTDGTARLLEEATTDSSLRVLTHESNRGYGASIKSGIAHANADHIVITDADGTYPNDQIPRLVDLASDVDMVVGSRTGANVHYPLIRKIPKVFLRAYASWIARTSIPDLNSGLRVFRRDVVNRFLFILSDGFSFTTTITLTMLTNGLNVRYVPIDYSPRIGRSKIKPIRDTLNFIHLIVRAGVYFAPTRTLFPLTMASLLVFLGSLTYDAAVLRNLTDKTILFFMFSIGLGLFTLAADVMSMTIKMIVTDNWGKNMQTNVRSLAGQQDRSLASSKPYKQVGA